MRKAKKIAQLFLDHLKEAEHLFFFSIKQASDKAPQNIIASSIFIFSKKLSKFNFLILFAAKYKIFKQLSNFLLLYKILCCKVFLINQI